MLQQQNLQYIDDIVTTKGQLGTALLQRDIIQGSLNDSAVLINNQIVTTDIISLNEKVINDIEISLSSGDSLSIAFITNLFNIAVQCPSAGGQPVYRARSLYSKFNDTIVYDDFAVCIAQGYNRSQQSNTAFGSLLHSFIQPNPATDQAELIYSMSKGEGCMFEVQDLTGRIQFSHNLNCAGDKFAFSTSELTNGMYLYTLKESSNMISKGKFIIQR